MFSLSHHPTSSAVSFQESHALAPLLRNGKPSSVNSSIFTRFPVDADLLKRSLALACANHEAFSTRFSVDSDYVFHREVQEREASDLFLFAEREGGESLEDAFVTEQIAEFYKTSFAFADRQYLRVLLLRTRDGSSLIVFRAPHLIYDAASVRIFITEVWDYYEKFTKDESVTPAQPRFSLTDYAASQQVWAASPQFERQFDGLLKHAQGGLDRLADHKGNTPHQPLPSREGVFRLAKLPVTTQSHFTQIAAHLKVTINVLLMAVTIVFLSHLCVQRHFCFRMPFSGRVASGTDRIVGFLSNDLPIFVQIRETDTFAQFARQVQQESMSAMRYGAIPWHLLSGRLSATHATTPFNDYLINIIPAVEHFGRDEALRAWSFPLPITGKTNSILKILMYVLGSGTSVTLKTGQEQETQLAEFVLPDFIDMMALFANAPDTPLSQVLKNEPPPYWVV